MEEKDIPDEISKQIIEKHQIRRKEQIQKKLWDHRFHPKPRMIICSNWKKEKKSQK